eukprot:CAMPEP_0194742858 /NCGR_PEP_ID=MMETSP0296-20130528/99990_1 /TAXON_ID=39354 /ORGANISM="Heterosigma akashiwo, Strain CCMP2393" /LENGTH=204 /DNA_ID=CAMNT_0039654829 /DNA_START=187 /DNA_END=802 /DNA_ORIENTATION=+
MKCYTQEAYQETAGGGEGQVPYKLFRNSLISQSIQPQSTAIHNPNDPQSQTNKGAQNLNPSENPADFRDEAFKDPRTANPSETPTAFRDKPQSTAIHNPNDPQSHTNKSARTEIRQKTQPTSVMKHSKTPELRIHQKPQPHSVTKYTKAPENCEESQFSGVLRDSGKKRCEAQRCLKEQGDTRQSLKPPMIFKRCKAILMYNRE